VGVLLTCSLRGKRGVGRETWAGGDRHLLMVGARGWKSGEGTMWGRHHVVEEDVGVGGLARCPGDAIGRQQPDPPGGWRVHGQLALKQGRVVTNRWSPSYSNRRRRFRLIRIRNLNEF
jgi:hypothetical protein